MDRTGIMRANENVEQQENVRISEHAAKVRQARDARRKRILARSSERLAFITGEAYAISTSPLLDRTNSIISVSHYSSPDQESSMKKNLFNEYKEVTEGEAPKKIVSNRENTSKAGAIIAQPLKNTDTMEASMEQVHETSNENPITFKSKFSYCIKQSLFPRLICATSISLTFLMCSYYGGLDTLSMIDSPSTSGGLKLSGHLGHPDALCMICFSLAIVMLVDLLLFMGAFFFPGTEGSKLMRNRKAMGKNSTLSILLKLLLSISLDCSISASLLSGGLLVLSKYFPNHISGVA